MGISRQTSVFSDIVLKYFGDDDPVDFNQIAGAVFSAVKPHTGQGEDQVSGLLVGLSRFLFVALCIVKIVKAIFHHR
jgi:uncharacterized protein (DUF2267 family)